MKYGQSVWGFQPRKAGIRKVCDVKGLFRNRNHLDVCKDRFKQRCQKSFYESFPFLSSPKARITKALERLILKLRAEMPIRGIAEHFNISWDTAKEVERRFLADRYRHVPLGKVRGITVDEMKVFNQGRPSRKFIAIVRDAETGGVLSVSRGKGADALKMFSSRIRRSGARIRHVCMDMSKAYTAWAQEALPKAEIVYDRFHLMKMMNERLDGARRRVARKLGEDAAKDLVYATARNGLDAYCLPRGWCAAADATGVPELAAMAKTIRRHIKGILGYWKLDGATNASMEGFN